FELAVQEQMRRRPPEQPAREGHERQHIRKQRQHDDGCALALRTSEHPPHDAPFDQKFPQEPPPQAADDGYFLPPEAVLGFRKSGDDLLAMTALAEQDDLVAP